MRIILLRGSYNFVRGLIFLKINNDGGQVVAPYDMVVGGRKNETGFRSARIESP